MRRVWRGRPLVDDGNIMAALYFTVRVDSYMRAYIRLLVQRKEQ